jgi:hypothetical protein
MSNDNTILTNFADTILNLDNSIRWIGITNNNGIIINEKYREGLKLLLNKEENQESAINTITRHKTRAKFEPKIGKLTYAFGRYDKFSRFIIPLNENYYLIITIDYSENNFDKIIMDKLIPLIKEINKSFSS